MKTGLITSDTSQNHDTGPGHPEQIARVSVIVENFKKLNNKNLIWKKPSKVSDDILLTTHENNYLNLVKNSFPKKGFSSLAGDTIISPGSKDATFDAVGSIIAAIDGVEKKEFRNAFCGVRPPGHHSSQNKAAGFCILNSVSIGANYLLKKYKLAQQSRKGSHPATTAGVMPAHSRCHKVIVFWGRLWTCVCP